jgi:hypothetical protein
VRVRQSLPSRISNGANLKPELYRKTKRRTDGRQPRYAEYLQSINLMESNYGL